MKWSPLPTVRPQRERAARAEIACKLPQIRDFRSPPAGRLGPAGPGPDLCKPLYLTLELLSAARRKTHTITVFLSLSHRVLSVALSQSRHTHAAALGPPSLTLGGRICGPYLSNLLSARSRLYISLSSFERGGGRQREINRVRLLVNRKPESKHHTTPRRGTG